MLGRKIVTLGDPRSAGGTPTELAALPHEMRTGFPMNGPIDATSPEQGRVSGIHDGVHGQFRDVTQNDFDPVHYAWWLAARLREDVPLPINATEKRR